MNLQGLSAHVRQFAEHVLAAFPEWASTLEAPVLGDLAGDCSFSIAPPACPSHRLYIVTRGNSVEVRYDDGQPPGPAEKLFVELDRNPAEVAESVIAFFGTWSLAGCW